MKRLLLPGIMGLMLAQPLVAQQNTNTFLWTGTTLYSQTNNPAPEIDALNFVVANGAEFGVDTTTIFPYTTSDTLNVTNLGFMEGFPGFDFEYFPLNPPPPQPGVPYSSATMAGTFANIADGLGGGTIECVSFAVVPPAEIESSSNGLGLAILKVNATNIINNGLIQMDNSGLLDLRGQHLDLRRGTLTMTPNPASAEFNIPDWGSGGYGTNSGFWAPGSQLTATSAQSALFTNFNRTLLGVPFILSQSTPYIENINGVPNPTQPGSLIWRYIFLQDSSPPNVTHNVYFGTSSDLNQPGEFHIEWIAANTDPVTGLQTNSYLYLTDDPAARRPTNYNFALAPIHPINTNGDFSVVASPVQIFSGTLATPSINDFTNPWPLAVTNDFSYISLQLGGTTVTNTVAGGSVTNAPGRIQLTASQDLNLANARISVPYYLSLSSPNFQGNTNALISPQFADLNLGVTNGSLILSNLLNPAVPIWTGVPIAPTAVAADAMGGIQAWSGSFTNTLSNSVVTFSNGLPFATNTVIITNDVRILLVNSAVQPSGTAYQQNVQLDAPNNLVISDDLNIFGSFSSDTQVLTIATNGPGAFSSFGVINLLSPDIFWSTSLPDLQYFTNWGVFSSENFTVFAGGMSSPISNPDFATPYQAFVNNGIIDNGGTFIRTSDFENSGVIEDDFGGSIDIVATSANSLATNGQFFAPGGHVSITANSLLASNGIIEAGGGPITLNASCSLSDGYIFGNQFAHFTNAMYPHVVTNGNIWFTSGGIQVAGAAQQADLLGTTVEDTASGNFVSPIEWAGQDRGPLQGGFADNLAVGQMMLQSDATSVFNFVPANGANAIYVDSIEFFGNTTNTDLDGNPLSVAIQPGMNVYYAEATKNGVSVAEKLNGKFGAANTNSNAGRFFWVTNYAGVYSSTNIHYPDGNTYIFNHALAISPDINSGGPDGTEVTNNNLVNSQNKFPIPTNVLYDITVQGPQPCPGTNNVGNNPTNSPGSPLIAAHLTLPPEAPASLVGSSNAPIVFSVAAGAYNGLFYDTNAVKPSSSGYFSATVTSKGGFSAKLQLGSHAYSFSGTFNSSGSAVVNAASKGLPTLSVSLQLVNNDVITGSVSGNNWVAQLQADRAAYTSKNGTSSAGKETLLLASDDGNSTTATGDGFGSATISTGGNVQLSATLPDGVKITQKSALSKAGVWPVYSSLYGGAGVFIGWMQCTNEINILGSAVWEMPGGAGGLYPGGLTNQIDASGTRLQGKVGFSGSGSAILSGAGLGTSLTNNVVVNGKTVVSGNTLKLSINPQTGLFNGSVTLPNSKQKLSFQGALLESSGTGGGFFLNEDQSGKVYFGPAN